MFSFLFSRIIMKFRIPILNRNNTNKNKLRKTFSKQPSLEIRGFSIKTGKIIFLENKIIYNNKLLQKTRDKSISKFGSQEVVTFPFNLRWNVFFTHVSFLSGREHKRWIGMKGKTPSCSLTKCNFYERLLYKNAYRY